MASLGGGELQAYGLAFNSLVAWGYALVLYIALTVDAHLQPFSLKQTHGIPQAKAMHVGHKAFLYLRQWRSLGLFEDRHAVGSFSGLAEHAFSHDELSQFAEYRPCLTAARRWQSALLNAHYA